MRIVSSVTYYDPYISGLSLHVKRLTEALVKRGHDVAVLCIKHQRELREVGVIGGVRVVRAKPFFQMSKGFLSFDFVRQAWRESQQADIIIINLPQFEGVWLALFGRLGGKNVIAIYHCEVILPAGFVNGMIQRLLEASNMITLFLAHRVVTYTDDYAKNSRLLRILRSSKVLAIYPPMPKPVVRANVVAALKKKIGPADVVIGVAARLAAEKGIEYLFAAIPLLKLRISNFKFKIVVAGSMTPVGEEAYKKKIMQLVTQYKEQIIFLGEIPPEDMGSFYGVIDVLVLPSLNATEAFGMVQVEAMMTGVPVVASDLPGVRVPIQKIGMGVLAKPGDSTGLAEAIYEILSHPDLYKEVGAQKISSFACDKSVNAFEKLFV